MISFRPHCWDALFRSWHFPSPNHTRSATTEESENSLPKRILCAALGPEQLPVNAQLKENGLRYQDQSAFNFSTTAQLCQCADKQRAERDAD